MSPLSILLGVDIARRADLDLHFWLRAVLGSIGLFGLLLALNWYLTRIGGSPHTNPGGGRMRLIRRVSISMSPDARARNRVPRFPWRARVRRQDKTPPSPSA